MTYRLIGFSVFFVSMNVFVIGCSDTGGLRGADAAAGASTIVGGSQGTAGAAGGQTTAGGTGTVATGGQSASGGASEVAGGSGGQPSGGATGTLVITGGQPTGGAAGSFAGGSGGQSVSGAAGSVAGGSGGQSVGGAAGASSATGGQRTGGAVTGGSGGQASGGAAGASSSTGGQRTGGAVTGGSAGQSSGGAGGASSSTGGQRTGGAVTGGSGGQSSGGTSGTGGSAACPVLTQTKSSRAAHSSGFSGTPQTYSTLYNVNCTTVADCIGPCVQAGGTQVSCAGSECVDGLDRPDYCLPPTFWFYLDRLRIEGGTMDSSAEIIIVYNPYRDQLVANDFQFEIPAEATVQGIVMSINRSADWDSAVADYEVRLVRDAATTVGLDRAGTKAWPTTFQYADYGGPTDRWGTSWTPADVNATGFGVALTPMYLDTAGNARAYVDFVRATVTYSLPCH